MKRGKAPISGGEAHSGSSPWGYKKPSRDTRVQWRSCRWDIRLLAERLVVKLASAVGSSEQWSSFAGRFASATKGASRSAELGGPGKPTLKRSSERPVHSSSASSARPDQAAVKAGRPRGTEPAARPEPLKRLARLHHRDRAETPEATGPKTHRVTTRVTR